MFEPEAFTNAVDARSEIVRVSRNAFAARKNCRRVPGTVGRWAPQRRESSRHRLVSCSASGTIEFGLFERNGEQRLVAYDAHTSTIFLTVVYAPGRTRLVWSADYCYTLTENEGRSPRLARRKRPKWARLY